MSARNRVIQLLTPLRVGLASQLERRPTGDPLELVRERFERLLINLENDPPTVTRVQTLHELAFLAEHSQNHEVRDFNHGVREAINVTISEAWG